MRLRSVWKAWGRCGILWWTSRAMLIDDFRLLEAGAHFFSINNHQSASDNAFTAAGSAPSSGVAGAAYRADRRRALCRGTWLARRAWLRRLTLRPLLR